MHTFSLPVSSNLSEIYSNADQEAVVSLVAKMGKRNILRLKPNTFRLSFLLLAADRSTTSSMQDAREAMTNVACDVLRVCLSNSSSNRAFSLVVPYSLRLIPLYMLSMIKSVRLKKNCYAIIAFEMAFRPHFELVVHRKSMIERIM